MRLEPRPCGSAHPCGPRTTPCCSRGGRAGLGRGRPGHCKSVPIHHLAATQPADPVPRSRTSLSHRSHLDRQQQGRAGSSKTGRRLRLRSQPGRSPIPAGFLRSRPPMWRCAQGARTPRSCGRSVRLEVTSKSSRSEDVAVRGRPAPISCMDTLAAQTPRAPIRGLVSVDRAPPQMSAGNTLRAQLAGLAGHGASRRNGPGVRPVQRCSSPGWALAVTRIAEATSGGSHLPPFL